MRAVSKRHSHPPPVTPVVAPSPVVVIEPAPIDAFALWIHAATAMVLAWFLAIGELICELLWKAIIAVFWTTVGAGYAAPFSISARLFMLGLVCAPDRSPRECNMYALCGFISCISWLTVSIECLNRASKWWLDRRGVAIKTP